MRAVADAHPLLRSSHEDGSNPFRAIRSAFAINQVKAASLSNVSRTLWAAWETRQRPISVHQLGDVVRAFSLGEAEVRWICEWWGDAHSAPLTVAQLNVLKTELSGSSELDVAGLLVELYEGVPRSS